jgi:hypothetical protein
MPNIYEGGGWGKYRVKHNMFYSYSSPHPPYHVVFLIYEGGGQEKYRVKHIIYMRLGMGVGGNMFYPHI